MASSALVGNFRPTSSFRRHSSHSYFLITAQQRLTRTQTNFIFTGLYGGEGKWPKQSPRRHRPHKIQFQTVERTVFGRQCCNASRIQNANHLLRKTRRLFIYSIAHRWPISVTQTPDPHTVVLRVLSIGEPSIDDPFQYSRRTLENFEIRTGNSRDSDGEQSRFGRGTVEIRTGNSRDYADNADDWRE
jgi:hypothetical protein